MYTHELHQKKKKKWYINFGENGPEMDVLFRSAIQRTRDARLSALGRAQSQSATAVVPLLCTLLFVIRCTADFIVAHTSHNIRA